LLAGLALGTLGQTGTARLLPRLLKGRKSGHTSVASVAKYARPSAEALARWQERNDPARRW